MEFGILGPLEVVDAGGPVPVPGAKERAVLAYLLLHAGDVVRADRLIDELWGEEPPESARKSLQVRVANLRKALGADSVVSRPSGYLMVVPQNGLDLERFHKLLADAELAAPAESAELLREALRVWRGPALADFYGETWARPAIARLEELRVLALENRIEADLVLGRHAELVGELGEHVEEFPLRERLRSQLMLALYRSGRQVEALEVYRSARHSFVEQLGIEPTSALQDLERAILRQEPSLQLTQPSPTRSILLVALVGSHLDALLALGEPLAKESHRELIMARPVEAAAQLADASADLERRRQELLKDATAARAVAFTSKAPARDAVRIAEEQDVDLLLVDAPVALLDDAVLRAIVDGAPCDVAAVVGSEVRRGPVLVPFSGAGHDWSAVELGAWLARVWDVPLRMVGPRDASEDASRLLANASLAVQRSLRIAAEPLLVEPGVDGLVGATRDAQLVVAGLSDRWAKDGLGPVRSAVVADAGCPVLLVRRGLRPGGLAPPQSHTRFTWSVGPGT
ncbi:MAG: AfsR/SARP family transcriptional regulator [Gaiellaceae bacterium]